MSWTKVTSHQKSNVGTCLASSLAVGDVLTERGTFRKWSVKWIHNDMIGLRGTYHGMSVHSTFPLSAIEAGRWDLNDLNPSVTQTGDNWTDDQESEAPSAMGADPSGEEEAGQGFMKERDRLRPKYKNQPIIDPASPPAGHSEVTDRVTQPPRDGA